MSLNFACVMRSGGCYEHTWTIRLCRQALEHLKPDRIVCLTDNIELAPHGTNRAAELVPLVHNWPGWFSKIELLRPGLFSGPVVYFDLDSLLLSPIDFAPVFARLRQGPERLAMLDDFFRPSIPASGVMAWIPSSETEMIYRGFVSEPQISSRWSQGDGWIIGKHPHVRLQSILPGAFASYKAHKLQATPAGFPHVSFHGKPKNNDFPPGHWVTKAWLGPNAGCEGTQRKGSE